MLFVFIRPPTIHWSEKGKIQIQVGGYGLSYCKLAMSTNIKKDTICHINH